MHDFSSTQPSPEEWFESTFGWYEEVGQLMAKLEPDYEEGTLSRISATGLDEMVLLAVSYTHLWMDKKHFASQK